MFELKKTFSFEAGHQLPYHQGKCSHPHGHSYVLHVHVRHPHLVADGPSKNMVTDFDDISRVVKPMIQSYLDHRWLNDTLNNDSPTAEFIAKWIFDHLYPLLPNLYAITIQETATGSVTYTPNP